MSLTLLLASQSLNALAEPKGTNDAVTKRYVDDLMADNVGDGNINGGDSPFFKENGIYQATYPIDMGFKKLLNLPIPIEASDPATKSFVENVLAAIPNP